MTLSLSCEPSGAGCVRIALGGELVASDAAPLREALHRLLRTSTDVVFDLAGLASWSVGCQAALVDAARSVRLAGGRVLVQGLTGTADRQAFDSGLHASLFCSPATARPLVVDLTGPRAERAAGMPAAAVPVGRVGSR